jgi:hypothetical protein
MKKLTKNQWTNIILSIVGLIVLWLAYKVVIKGQSINEIFGGLPKPKEDTTNSTTSPTSPSGGGTGAGTQYNGGTVFSVKSPFMRGDQVQWIQYRYNKLARLRKEKGKTPDWATITEDGIYGNQTATAVNRVMGKNSTSWNEFKAKVEDLEVSMNMQFGGSGGSW